MKKILLALGLVASASVYAQAGRLVLTASINGLPNDTTVYLYSFQTKMYDSTVTKDHGFKFDLQIATGDVYALVIGKQSDLVHATALYLEPGTVTIKGDGPCLTNAVYEGSSWVAEWKEMNALMNDSVMFKGARELPGLLTEARRVGDRDRYKELLAIDEAYNQKRIEIGTKWIQAHPNSPISACLYSFYMMTNLPVTERPKYLAMFGEGAKHNIIAEKLYHPDVIAVARPGVPARVFTQPDVNGKMVSLADYKGKYVLVDFWASWCKPCRAKNPSLVALYDKYKDRNFTILGISMDSDKDKWLKAIEDDKLSWTQVSDLKGADNAVAKMYNIIGIPASFLVGPDGVVIVSGGDENELIKVLEKMLPPATKN